MEGFIVYYMRFHMVKFSQLSPLVAIPPYTNVGLLTAVFKDRVVPMATAIEEVVNTLLRNAAG